MKPEVQKLLKEKGRADIFTQARFETIKEFMKLARKNDKGLDVILGMDVMDRVNFVADHMIKFVDLNKI